MNTLAHINTLHELLALALEDLEKAEKDPKVTVDMEMWHVPTTNGCAVCLAGAVIRGTLDVPDNARVGPAIFDRPTTWRLSALNALRQGAVEDAYCEAGDGKRTEAEVKRLDRPIASYHDRDQWWRDMRKLLADLREANV